MKRCRVIASRGRTAKDDGPEPVDVHVGQRLRLARHLAGVSQTVLGDAMGISFQAVQKYENGENRISASRLYAAARLVRQPVSYFFDEVGIAPAATAGQSFSHKEIELVRWYRQLTDDVLRHQLVEMTKVIGHGARPKTKAN